MPSPTRWLLTGCLALLPALLLVGCGQGDPTAATRAATAATRAAPDVPPWLAQARPDDPTWLVAHRELLALVAGKAPEVVFLGDSITFAWTSTGSDSWSVFSRYRPIDLGLPGDTTQNVLWRVDHGELSGIHPRVVVVMIGTNNLPGSDPTAVVRGIEAVVSDVRSRLPDSRVLLLGVLPIAAPGDAVHQRATRVDALLAQHRFGPTVRLLDLAPSFSYPDGDLRPDLYRQVCLTGTDDCDSLEHPSTAGYAAMARVIAPVLASMTS